MINRQLVHYDTAGQRVIIQPGDLTNVGGDVYAITPAGAVTSVADVPNTIPIRDADGGFEVGYLQVDTTPPVVETSGVAKLIWDDTNGTIEFQLKGGNTTMHIGETEVVRVKNDSGGAYVGGEAVYISGSNGVNLLTNLANASTEATSAATIGIVAEAIASNQHGFVTTFGLVRNINTNHLVEGAPVWLSTVAGQTTATRPSAPNHGVLLGFCLRKSATVGAIFARVDNGWELDELHNVLISSVAAGDVLVRNVGNTLWENKAQSTLSVGYATTAGGAPPTGAASGDLAGTYPGPTLAVIGGAATKGTASKSATVTIDTKGRVTSISDQDIAIAESQVTNLTTDLAAKAALAGATFTGSVNIGPAASQLFLTGAGNLRMGVGFGAGSFSSANAVVEFKPSTSSRFTFLDNVVGAIKNPVFTLVDLDATGKGMALYTDTTASAFIYDNAGGFNITSDTKANISAGTFGTGTLRFAVEATTGKAHAYYDLRVDGIVGIGVASPSAYLHLKAGTATASTAPLKFNSGTLLTTAEAGAVEFNTDDYYATITTGAARKPIVLADAALTVNQGAYATTNGRLTSNKRYQIYATGTTDGTAGTSVSLTAAALATSGDLRYIKLTVKAKGANVPPAKHARTLECFWGNGAGTLTQTGSDVLGTQFASGNLTGATIVSAASGTNVVITCTDVTGVGATVTWEIFGEYY